MSAADDALRAIMDAIEIDTVAEVPAVHFTPVGLADLAGALADLIEAARAEGEAAGAARERAAVAAYLRDCAAAHDGLGSRQSGNLLRTISDAIKTGAGARAADGVG